MWRWRKCFWYTKACREICEVISELLHCIIKSWSNQSALKVSSIYDWDWYLNGLFCLLLVPVKSWRLEASSSGVNISPSSLDNHDADSVVKNLSSNGSSTVEVRGTHDSSGLAFKAPYSNQASFALCYLNCKKIAILQLFFMLLIKLIMVFLFHTG